MSPSSEYAITIQDWPVPNTGKQLRQFLGLVNYLHQFIPGLAHVTGPLSDLSSTPGRQKLPWTQEHQAAFVETKNIARKPMALSTPMPGQGYTLETDASNLAMGVVLKQQGRLIAIFSKKLNTAQQKYSAHDKEALAIYKSLRYFRYYILGDRVNLPTDHKPLVNLMETSEERMSEMKRWWISEVQAYDIHINYIKGKYNNLADYLSRQSVASIGLRDDSNLHRKQNEPSFMQYKERYYPQALQV